MLKVPTTARHICTHNLPAMRSVFKTRDELFPRLQVSRWPQRAPAYSLGCLHGTMREWHAIGGRLGKNGRWKLSLLSFCCRDRLYKRSWRCYLDLMDVRTYWIHIIARLGDALDLVVYTCLHTLMLWKETWFRTAFLEQRSGVISIQCCVLPWCMIPDETQINWNQKAFIFHESICFRLTFILIYIKLFEKSHFILYSKIFITFHSHVRKCNLLIINRC